MPISRLVAYSSFALLLAVVACPPARAQDAAMPEWIKNINPVDYVLVNPDSTPAFPFHVEGEINAYATVQAYGITLPDGTSQARREFLLFAQETIVANNLVKTQVKGKTLQWKLTWDVNVMVFETPEVAAAVVKDRWGDTWGVDPLTDQALGDPRLHKQGVAAANGDLVRYRNLIWHVLNRRIEEVKPPGGRDPMPMDEWNAGYGEAQHQQYYKLSQALAKAWLNKVAGPPVPDVGLIGLDFDWRGITPQVKGVPFREPRADHQWISARVQNRSQEQTAQNVMVQFYVQYPGEATATKLGEAIKVADNLGPLGIAGASIMWDLKGKPVENATVSVECFIPDKPDPEPADNVLKEGVSIWFAQDATGRPFTWGYDTYSFVNTGFEEQEVEELVEGILATVLNNIQETPEARKVLQVALFPPSYQRLQKYFDTSMKAGAGGHCYGMAATAAVYFENPALKPVAKPLKDLTLAEASVNINLYHRAQVLTLLDALVAGWDWKQGRIQGTVGCGNVVKQHLKEGKLCTVVDFFSPANAPPVGHSVLAYKYVEFQHGAPLVYVYDPNFPERAVAVSDAMPMIRLWGNDFRCPDYMDYRTWAGGGRIGANRPFRTISLETVNAVMPSIKAMISSMVKWLNTAGKFMGLVTCPADAYFTDAAGRRTGTVGGKVINEIPGAEIRSQGEVEIYVLPNGGQYTLTVNGTGDGTMSVSLLRATDAETIGVTSFQSLPIKAGTVFQGKVSPNGEAAVLTGGGQSFQPTLAGAYNVSKLPVKGSGQETGSTLPEVGEVVVCRDVVDGVPQGVSDSFDKVAKLYAFYGYKNVPEGTKVQVSWRRGGQEFSRGERGIGGTGSVWFSVSTSRTGGFEPGQYEVTITVGNQVARKSFVVGSPTPGPSEPTGGKPPPGGGGGGAGPTATDTGNLVVCREVVDGVPQGVADNFARIGKVCAFYQYENLPEKTKAQVSWRRGGREFFHAEREIGGTGSVWFSVSTTRTGGFEDGLYEVIITMGNQVARKSFTVGAPAPAASAPAGEQELIFSVSSVGVALNNATAPAKFTLPQARTISKLRTYHWNNGQGKTPGTIGLRDAAGKMYGPWQASGDYGQGGVKNAYWEVRPAITVPAGEYTVLDSDPGTWAQNAETGHRGMCEVWAVK